MKRLWVKYPPQGDFFVNKRDTNIVGKFILYSNPKNFRILALLMLNNYFYLPTHNFVWYLYNTLFKVATNFIENKGIIVNKNTIEIRRGRKRFIINRLNNIRFRNAKRYPYSRRDIL